MKILNLINKTLSLIIILSLLTITLYGCGNTKNTSSIAKTETSIADTQVIADQIIEEIQEEKNIESSSINYTQNKIDQFVFDLIFDELSVCYNTFNASIKLENGTEVYGIGYSDFSSYLESDDENVGLFPAGFILLDGDINISSSEKENGIFVNNLDYENENYGFLYTESMDSFFEHCVIDGKYIKYGVDNNGIITYTSEIYSEENVDTSLGSLYSYDDEQYLYDPDVGEYQTITGESLFETIDYDELEKEINEILDEQDKNFSSTSIETTAYYAQEAVNSYLLSLQEETFMGCNVTNLREEVSKLDPMECIRITPEGHVVIDIGKDLPQKPSTAAKWIVGTSCAIAVASSIALGVFVPAVTPASGAICGSAIEVFMEVVLENYAVEDINWEKVAIATTAGAIMAWACPLGASTIAESVGAQNGNVALSKLAGYGFQTFGNALVTGTTNATYAALDDEDIMDAFLFGAAIGGACTIVASGLSEASHVRINILQKSHPENWFIKATKNTSIFIREHQYHISNSNLENILNPKSVYEASRAGVYEFNQQVTLKAGKRGGAYCDVKINSNGDYTQVHETPSFESTGAVVRKDGPSIKMSKEDHRLTASFGNSKDAQEYRAAQTALIKQGNYHDAIQMDIDDIHLKFGDKYDDAIKEMLEYATQIGWW